MNVLYMFNGKACWPPPRKSQGDMHFLFKLKAMHVLPSMREMAIITFNGEGMMVTSPTLRRSVAYLFHFEIHVLVGYCTH